MKDDPYILCIDQSTSGTKALFINSEAQIVARSNAGHTQIYPETGWVEHDPEEIYNKVLQVIADLIDSTKIPSKKIACLSITNQRETIVVWDKLTGKPLHNAVVWQCMRGEPLCRQLKDAGHEEFIRSKTGLIIDPYFSASGLSWMIKNVPEIRKKMKAGELAAGTMDSWLIWKLTNGRSHKTDYTNASRTLLYDIHHKNWDKDIAGLFEIPVDIMPEVRAADDTFGYTNINGLLNHDVPICGVLGDSHAALFGQRCFNRGMAKVTYGTGSSVMMNIGDTGLEAPTGLVTSIGYALKSEMTYVFEGNIHSTGGTIKWMVDGLDLIASADESETLAETVDSTEGVYFIPAFAGLGAPYWNNSIRASISGISGGTTKAHIVRAGLESIAFQVKDLLDLMKEKAGIVLAEIRVDGGPTANAFLMQFQSDMLSAPILVSEIEEASALGAALAGGIGTGVWSSLRELEGMYTSKSCIRPAMDDKLRDMNYNGWKASIGQQLK